MTKEDAARILDPETTRNALSPYIYDPGRRISVVEEACRIAAAALRTGHSVDTDKMVPLTLEQLREMHGNPVLIHELDGEKYWAIVDKVSEHEVRLLDTVRQNDYGSFELYGESWLAYAYPPARIDREAWTAEWIEQKTERGTVQYICSKCFDYHEFRSDAVISYIVRGNFLFCRKCGRAMTPEAWDELEKRLRG